MTPILGRRDRRRAAKNSGDKAVCSVISFYAREALRTAQAMNIYEELGIRPFLNAYRPLTRLGGATLPAAVVEAMEQASRQNIDLRTMQFKVGAAIAAMTGNEAAYISCGAASGITLAVATCIAGTNAELADRLPDATGLRRSVVMHKCERGYKSDVAIRCAGGTILDIGTQEGSTSMICGKPSTHARRRSSFTTPRRAGSCPSSR